MTTTTITDTKQQSLKQDITICLVENNVEALFKILNDVEIDLEEILVNEFEQGLLIELPGL